MKRLTHVAAVVFGTALAMSAIVDAADWTRFRGPNGSGTSADAKTPIRWSDKENLVWKTPLPGPGTSSPIVTGGKIFLTSYTGYGVDANNAGDSNKLERILVCVNEKDG